jgi:hypothetical protein
MPRCYANPCVQLGAAILLRAISARQFLVHDDLADLIMTTLQIDRQAVLDELGLSNSEHVWWRAGPGGHAESCASAQGLYFNPQEVSK